jgi:hypothetical protein
LNFNSNPIWRGEITQNYSFDCQVSPDNQFIAFVRDKKEIIVLRSDGKLLTKISPISKIWLLNERESGDYRGENFQWSNDSEKLFVIRDNKIEGSEKYKSSIFQYSITGNKLTELIDLEEECNSSFFFDSTYEHLYYQIVMGGAFYIKRIRLDNPRDSKIYTKSGIKIDEIEKENLFINYYNDQFGNWDSNGKNIFTENGIAVGFYFFCDTSFSRLVFKTKWGSNAFKGTGYGFQVGNSGFMPNDGYYFTGCSAENFGGTIFIEVKTLTYSFKDFRFGCYYSITNEHFRDFVLRYEIEPNLRFETSMKN